MNLVRLYDPRTGQGLGSLDYFDLESDHDGLEGVQKPLTLEHVEKWWCVGDTRNRGTVWVQGNAIRNV